MAKKDEKAKLTIDNIITLYKTSLDASYLDKNIEYSIKQEDNLVTISVWSNGLTQEAMMAMLNEEYKKDWNYMVDSLTGTQKIFQNIMNENGHTDTLVAIGVLNDINKDNLLLYISLGMTLYDIVNNINLLELLN